MNGTVPVWFDTLHVGDVAVADDGSLSFRYAARWLATQGAFPLSLTMPLADAPYPSEIISPWLANLLPEEEQLQILTRSLGLDRADTLAVLAEIGGDTAGALSFSSPTDPNAWAWTPLTDLYDTADPQAALERHFEDLGRRPFLVGEEGVRQSLAGGQKKSALAVLSPDGTPVLRLPQPGDVLAVPRNGAPSTVIVKPDNPNLPGITENEVFCLHLAQAIGIAAAQTTILTTGKRTAICALRYDRRVGRAGQLQRVHQEDFAQANGIPPGRKYERGTIAGPDLRTLLATGHALPPMDALALLDQVIFNILVANTDAHAKNYSILLPVGGEPRLAPLYDVSTVLPWPHVTQYFAQNLAAKRRRPEAMAGRHWDIIAGDMGYRPADLRQRVQELVDAMVANRVTVAGAVASLPGVTSGYVEQAAELIETNALRIAGRLG
ncbi:MULTISPECIES: HipA domain-containing protein [Paracoccus]|uniref:HipA domain-containing protein n=1 Tax=Paracoccus TaxID=265 RepID=UPI001FB6B1AA|nr:MULTISPECIES: HipA domain-containing protein [Paracoccus]MCJ1901454.1 HipA domain-containing protein [Paracoccus versutus]MDF3907809.1 HipA domain-containing protein [Paracoccus sp. AS002]